MLLSFINVDLHYQLNETLSTMKNSIEVTEQKERFENMLRSINLVKFAEKFIHISSNFKGSYNGYNFAYAVLRKYKISCSMYHPDLKVCHPEFQKENVFYHEILILLSVEALVKSK